MLYDFPPKIPHKKRISALTAFIQHCTRSSNQCNQVKERVEDKGREKKQNNHSDWKEVKLSFFTDNIIITV